MCHMFHVTCHVSHVTCHMLFFFSLFFWTNGEAYRWNVCYQRGLPHLVYAIKDIFWHHSLHINSSLMLQVFHVFGENRLGKHVGSRL